MAEFVVNNERGWSKKLLNAVKQADHGDVIFVPHIDALVLGKTIAQRLRKNLTFVII